MILVSHVLAAKGNDVWAVAPHTMTLVALKLMAEKNVGAVLVLDDGRLAGIFSERDYARKVVLHGRSSRETPVSELMSSRVVTVSPDDTVQHCMEVMTAERIRHLPVMRGEAVVGVITIGDVVKHIISEQAETIRTLEQYITQG